MKKTLNPVLKLMNENDKSEIIQQLDDATLQKLLEFCIYTFSLKKQEGNHELDPLPSQNKLTDTDVLMLVDHLLTTRNIDLFEVQMYRSFCM